MPIYHVVENKMGETEQKYNKKEVAIIGGEPAGLTASYELSKVGAESIVLEKIASNNRECKGDNVVMPVISVIIPSYNSSTNIRQCLQAIRSQSTELPFEIIMVDSSNDGTDQIVANEFPEVRLFHFQERLFVGAARNKGIEKARGEVMLFLDTDCVTKHTWIEQMYEAIQDFDADVVGGSVENGTPWSITGSTGFYLEFFHFLANGERPCATPFFMGGNSGYRKEVFRTNGTYNLFNEDGIPGEEFIFNWKLMKKGKVLMFLPSVAVRHLNKTGLLKVLRYQYKLGIGAYSYRCDTSSDIMSLFKHLPILAFFIPFGIMVWIGSTVLRRRGVLEFLKFVVLLPFLYMGNNVWAMGFYRELKKGKSKTRHANNDVAEVSNFQRLFGWEIQQRLFQKIASLKRTRHE